MGWGKFDLIRALGVARLALFGSVLRGQTHAQSDVDLLVQFAPGTKTYDLGPRILAEAQDVLRAA